MKTSTLLTAAVAAVSMLGAPSAFAATPAASKLSLASAPSLRAGGVDKRRVNRQFPSAPATGGWTVTQPNLPGQAAGGGSCATNPSNCQVGSPASSIANVSGGIGGGGRGGFLSNPFVIAGVVATAIAVPVALANSGSVSP